MSTTPAPVQVYTKRIDGLLTALQHLKKKKDIIAWSRFIAVVAIIAALYYLRPYGLMYTLASAALLFAAFLRLVVLSSKNNERIHNLQLLVQVNRQEIDIAAGNFADLPDGRQHLPPLHDYAHDLDILGRASIYQYVNRTTSEQGEQTFAGWLLHPASADLIIARQEAIAELCPQTEWRQQLQAYGMASRITISTQQKIKNWLAEPNLFAAPSWQWLRYVFPAIILSALLLNITGILPSPLFYGLTFIFLLISGYISRKVTPVYVHLNKIVKEINTIFYSVGWIESNSVKSSLLNNLHQQCIHPEGNASRQVKQLTAILDRLDYRLNALFFLFLNTFLFWDLQQVLALEKWKEVNKDHVMKWFEALSEMEALSTIATLRFNHPSWCIPVLDTREGTFIADALGHPLIRENKRVCSSFAATGTPRLALITGSNMAGKSTFLRSVGVNIVLAMMGAPVCAERLSISNLRVISSMRVTDNLEESTSTFYAELKKLKHIIEAVYKNEKVFLLLDEILRGTNSLDRHTGSRALIHQLIQHKAVGMLATHDLELAQLEKEHPDTICNYHFDVQVADDELYFDYKLKEGVCRSLNASILMKKIGIEM